MWPLLVPMGRGGVSGEALAFGAAHARAAPKASSSPLSDRKAMTLDANLYQSSQ
jgi:hypothetical protein